MARFVAGVFLSLSVFLCADLAHAGYTAAVFGGTLTVTGNGAGDRLEIRLSAGDMNVIELDVGRIGVAELSFDRTTFTEIDVLAGAGNDVVTVNLANGAFNDESLLIDGGPGHDTITGGSAADLIFGGDGNDTIDPGVGADIVLLGAGNDTVMWEPGDGSDTIEGQDGDDTLAFRASAGSEILTFSPNGGRVTFTRNIGAITMDLNDVEQVDLAALGAADTITVNDLTGTDLVRVNVDLGVSGAGDSQPDTIAVNGSAAAEVVSVGVANGVLEIEGLTPAVNLSHAEPAFDLVTFTVLGADVVHLLGTPKNDLVSIAPSPVVGAVRATSDTFPLPLDVAGGGRLIVFGLSGHDTISASAGIAALFTVLELDGGAGNDVITGGDGADTILGGPGNDRASGGAGNDLLLLGAGNDTARWNPGESNDTVDGQQGYDTLDFRGSNASEIIDLSPSGDHAVLTRNVAAIVMDLNDLEQVAVAMFGGSDSFTLNDMSGTDVRGVTLDLEGVLDSGTGDSTLDAIFVNGTAAADRMSIVANAKGVLVVKRGGNLQVEHADPTDVLTVNGGAGNDLIGVAPAASSKLTVTLNPD